MPSIAERLGRPSDARLIILSCDGLGSSNAANRAIVEALRTGVANSAALQVPCPWARGAAAAHQGDDVGVSLTFNAPYDVYRWGSITRAPSLFDGNGGFPTTVADLWEHADVDEIRREATAQIERAILWGFDPSFLHAHMNALSARPEFFDVYLDLAIDFKLPITLPDPASKLGFPVRDLAAEHGILSADYTVDTATATQPLRALSEAVANAKPGLTEIRLSPAFDSQELRSMDPEWAHRVADAHALIDDVAFRALLERSDVKQISYADLRSAQRD